MDVADVCGITLDDNNDLNGELGINGNYVNADPVKITYYDNRPTSNTGILKFTNVTSTTVDVGTVTFDVNGVEYTRDQMEGSGANNIPLGTQFEILATTSLQDYQLPAGDNEVAATITTECW